MKTSTSTSTNHIPRIVIIWLILSVIAELLLATVVPTPGPEFAEAGLGEHFTLALLFYLGAPIFVFVCVFLAYEVATFRVRPGESWEPDEDAPVPRKGSARLLFLWSFMSLGTVLFMAAWGIFTLPEITNAAGPNPLPVQVIAQQWRFTYRYPTYGGVESFDLAIPAGRAVRFYITSLDVVHEFWVRDLDVKEDAVPGVTTIANVEAFAPGNHFVVCNELCGIWHGFMRGPVYVFNKHDFAHWIAHETVKNLPITAKLPPFAPQYYPDPQAYPNPPQNSPQ